MTHIDGGFEITDLITEAVTNAKARRNQILETVLPILTDEQSGTIMGGQNDGKFKADRTFTGIITSDPTVR